MHSKLATLLLALSIPSYSWANPIQTKPKTTVHITRRNIQQRTPEEWSEWAYERRASVHNKYGNPLPARKKKRSTGVNLLTNQGRDSSFFGSLAIGTPPVAYSVILDTGSADLWLASDACTPEDYCPASIPTFHGRDSSSFQNTSKPFSITYGSGRAVGTLARETVNVAGFQVEQQTVALVSSVTPNLLFSPVSGLLGLAFSSLTTSGTQTWWQASIGGWDSPLFSFHLTRFKNVSSSDSEEFGGSFDIGFTNSSLFTGDIDYVDIPDGEQRYWTIPLRELSVNGNLIDGLPSIASSGSNAAIDTGTTLIGGPPELIANLYAQVPGAQPAGSQYEGYYAYPCRAPPTVTIAFGAEGRVWTIAPDDFLGFQLSQSVCIGAFFEFESGPNGPSWIVGDAFLKNVYSVYRAEPPSIGFAQLSSVAIAYNGGNFPVPTPTIGSVAAIATSDNSASITSPRWAALAVVFSVMFALNGWH